MDGLWAAHDELSRAEAACPAAHRRRQYRWGEEFAGEMATQKWTDKRVAAPRPRYGDDVLGSRFRADPARAELRRQLVDLGVELVAGEGFSELPPTVENIQRSSR